MSDTNADDRRTRRVSIVIPSYNSAPWLPATFAALGVAIAGSELIAEVVLVDDGSNDDTASVVTSLAEVFPVPVRLVRQDNSGRFLARWAGANAAKAPMLLLLDSRVVLRADAVRGLEAVLVAQPARRAVNGHVDTDPDAPLVGRFWEVLTAVFWSDYLASPRALEITARNFDRVPKGTGLLLIERELFLSACLDNWPDAAAEFVSDDTKLLRYVAERTGILLTPAFSAVYRPRTSVRAFLAHAHDRGSLFVDSYAGTSRVRSIVLLLLAVVPPLAVAAVVALFLLGGAAWAIGIVAAAIIGVLVLPVLALRAHCPKRAVLSYLTYVVPFGAVFWAGLVRGVLLHRAAFTRSSSLAGRP